MGISDNQDTGPCQMLEWVVVITVMSKAAVGKATHG